VCLSVRPLVILFHVREWWWWWSGWVGCGACRCAELANLDYETLETCVNGPEAAELLKKAYEDTPKDHQYVPWVVINGKVWNQEGSLITALCKAYEATGGTEPDACHKEVKNTGHVKYARDYARKPVQ
jgi:hypothetical protein